MAKIKDWTIFKELAKIWSIVHYKNDQMALHISCIYIRIGPRMARIFKDFAKFGIQYVPISSTPSVNKRNASASLVIVMPPFEGIITGAFIHFKFANGNFGIFSISATKFWFLQQETNRFTFFLRTESISVSFASAKREILTFSRGFVKIPKNTA